MAGTHYRFGMTQPLLQWFNDDHLDPGVRDVSGLFRQAANELARILPSDPETEWCLRMLLAAKDAGVRAALARQARTWAGADGTVQRSQTPQEAFAAAGYPFDSGIPSDGADERCRAAGSHVRDSNGKPCRCNIAPELQTWRADEPPRHDLPE